MNFITEWIGVTMGLLVALTGLDGSGKTTQSRRLYEKCLSEGLRTYYIHLREINSQPYYIEAVCETKKFIEKHRDTIKHNEVKSIISANLFIAKVNSVVIPKIAQNDVVIVDRYKESAECYHMLKWRFTSNIQELYHRVPDADINFFLDTDIETCIRRINTRREKTLYENYESLLKAREFYSSISKQFIWIDSNRVMEEITQELYDKIHSRGLP